MLGSHGHTTNLWGCIGRNLKAVLAAILEDRADGLFGVGESFFLVVALRDDFGKSGDEDCEASTLLWLKHD